VVKQYTITGQLIYGLSREVVKKFNLSYDKNIAKYK